MIGIRKKPLEVKVIALDLSSTIVDWEHAFEASLAKTAHEWLARWSEQAEKEKMIQSVMNRYKTERQRNKDRMESIRDALREMPIDIDDQTLDAVGQRIRALQVDHARWKDGVETSIKALSQRHRLIIITTLDRDKALELYHKLQLDRFIQEQDIFTSEQYRHIASTLKVRPQQCVIVGNGRFYHVKTALRAGWHAVFIRKKTRKTTMRRWPNGRMIRVIPSIQHLSDILAD